MKTLDNLVRNPAIPTPPSSSTRPPPWPWANGFGFAASVLEELRFELRAGGGRRWRLQLWPEHFDLGFNIEGLNFGASPGDGWSPEPYLYAGPWERQGLTGEFWNAPFGAALRYSELLAAPDQRDTALSFLRAGVRACALRHHR